MRKIIVTHKVGFARQVATDRNLDQGLILEMAKPSRISFVGPACRTY